MTGKRITSALVLLFCFLQLSASSFTFSASDVFSVKVRIDRGGKPVLSKAAVKLKGSSFTVDTSRLVAGTRFGTFYVRYGGGGGAEFDFGSMKLGFDYSVKKPEDPLEKPWFFTERSVSDRHICFDVLLKSGWFSGEAGLDFRIHCDRAFGLYADTRWFLDYSKNGIRIYAERSFTDSQKTVARLEFGTIFGAKLRINKGPAPVFGQTSGKHRTDYEIWFKAGSITAKAQNIRNVKRDTGTDYYTDFSIRLVSSILDLSANTRLSRTDGSVYAFGKTSVKMKITVTRKTDLGTLSIQFNEDRSIRISLQSEVSHAGAGKLRFTGDIDP